MASIPQDPQQEMLEQEEEDPSPKQQDQQQELLEQQEQDPTPNQLDQEHHHNQDNVATLQATPNQSNLQDLQHQLNVCLSELTKEALVSPSEAQPLKFQQLFAEIHRLKEAILPLNPQGIPNPPQVVLATSSVSDNSSAKKRDTSSDEDDDNTTPPYYTYPMKKRVPLTLRYLEKPVIFDDENHKIAAWKPERRQVDFDPVHFKYPNKMPIQEEPPKKRRKMTEEEKEAQYKAKVAREKARREAKKEEPKVNTMYLNRSLDNPPLVRGQEENFVLELTPFHFAQALVGDMRFGFDNNLKNPDDPWQDAAQWKKHKKAMAEVALKDLIEYKESKLGYQIYVQRAMPSGNGIFSGYGIPAFSQISETNGSQFPLFCLFCVNNGLHPQECLISWCTICHDFPIQSRPWSEREGSKGLGERHEFGPVKTYIRVDLLFPHDSSCQCQAKNKKFALPLDLLAREEYVSIPFPTEMVVKDEFQPFWDATTKGTYKNPMMGVPFGKGVDRIVNGIEGYDLDDRAYIKLPVLKGVETENARLLLGDSCMTAESFSQFYIRTMYAYMNLLSSVSEMCPFIADWPLEKQSPKKRAKLSMKEEPNGPQNEDMAMDDSNKNEADGEINNDSTPGSPQQAKQTFSSKKSSKKEKLNPQWMPNGEFHLVIREMSILLGGMFERPPSIIGFNNPITPQLFHMDDTNLDIEGRDIKSPFYRYGPDNKGEVTRPHMGIFPIFHDEQQQVALYHPSNKKRIWFNQLLAFDGATKHCGCTQHPCQVIVQDGVVGVPIDEDIHEDTTAKLSAVEAMMQNLVLSRKNQSEPDYSLGNGYTRRYSPAIHFHNDSMLLVKRRDGNVIDLTFYGQEEFPTFEPPEIYSKMSGIQCRQAHRRKEDDVHRGSSLIIKGGKILSDKDTSGIFKAKLLAESVACMPSKDLEDGLCFGKSKLVPAIPKGAAAAPALAKLCIGMFQRAACNDSTPNFTNDRGQKLLTDCARALKKVVDKYPKGELIIDAHKEMDTDEDEDVRRKEPRREDNEGWYTASSEHIYERKWSCLFIYQSKWSGESTTLLDLDNVIFIEQLDLSNVLFIVTII